MTWHEPRAIMQDEELMRAANIRAAKSGFVVLHFIDENDTAVWTDMDGKYHESPAEEFLARTEDRGFADGEVLFDPAYGLFTIVIKRTPVGAYLRHPGKWEWVWITFFGLSRLETTTQKTG